MAGRRSRSDGRQKRRADSAEGSRRRKPHVPPIIDLEATIVEDAGAAPGPDAASARAGDQENAEASARQSDQAASWMEEMKTFFFGGVHIGRWRIPAAGSLIVLGIFAGGLIAGRVMAPDGVTGPASERIAALEAALTDAATSADALAGRFDALEEKLDAANEHARSARSAADAALSEVRALDAGLQELAVETGDNASPAVDSLQKQIAELAAKLEQIAQNISTGEGAAVPEAIDGRIDALAAALNDLKVSVETLAARPAAPAGGGDVTAEAIIEAARTQLSETLDAVVARVDERLAAIEKDAAAPRQAGPNPASAAAAELHDAVESGGPYQRELAALATAMPGDPAIAAIAAHAPDGVATHADLVARFETVAAELSAAPSGADDAEDSDLAYDVWSRLTRLVELRKSTEPGSKLLVNAVDAARAQIDARDFAGAADALAVGGDGLTEAAATWIDDARARAHVDAQMNGLLRRAVLSAAGSEPSGS